jgi:hypothetical protein
LPPACRRTNDNAAKNFGGLGRVKGFIFSFCF